MSVPSHLIVVSAGGFGRNVVSMARQDQAFGKDWDVKGFLDDRPNVQGLPDVPILGDPLTYRVHDGDIFVCALGDPAARRHYTLALEAQGAHFIVLRPSLAAGERVTMGRGCIFEPNVSIGADAKLGAFVTVLATTILGYGVTVGDYVQIGSFVFCGGGSSIGNDVVIHPHATILPGVKVGDGAVIGAGSVVIRDVPPGVTMIGNPAKPFVFR
jgi:sugar O-acyltransferase (sialic acid O-acetyltransferase NeuD family)